MANFRKHLERAYTDFFAQKERGWFNAGRHEVIFESFAQFIQELEVRKGRSLEIDCGVGNLSIWLSTKGWDACGISSDSKQIQWARQNASEHKADVEFIVANVTDRLPFEDHRFNLIVDTTWWKNVEEEDRESFLREVLRNLAPDGWFFLETQIGIPAVTHPAFLGYSASTYLNQMAGTIENYYSDLSQIL